MSKPPKIDKNLVSNLRQARRIYACNCLLRAVASQPWPLGESSHKPSHTYLFTRFLHSFSSTCISHVTHSPHNGTTVISTCMYRARSHNIARKGRNGRPAPCRPFCPFFHIRAIICHREGYVSFCTSMSGQLTNQSKRCLRYV